MDKWKRHREVAAEGRRGYRLDPRVRTYSVDDEIERTVRALGEAGLLREDAPVVAQGFIYAHCSADCAEMARLTRERDEARRTRTVEFDKRREAEAQRDAALASAASPEVRRVVELAEKWRKEWCYTPVGTSRELIAAVDALSASRQPKAQEPRYDVEHFHDAWFVWDRQPGWNGSSRVAAFYCANSKERAKAECARLNAGGAR